MKKSLVRNRSHVTLSVLMLVIAGLARTGFGASVTIADFETTALDGWDSAGSLGSPAPTLSRSTNGVTTGTYALASAIPTGNFWGPATGNLISEGFISALSNATTISYDSTLNSVDLNGGSGSFDAWAQDNEMAIAIFSTTPSINLFIQENWATAGISDSSGMNAQWGGVDGTRHIVWDLTKFTATDPIAGGTKTVAQFLAAYPTMAAVRIGVTEQVGAPTAPAGNPTFFFDKVQLTGPGITIPPPPSLTLAKLQGPKGLYLLTTTSATLDSGNPQYERQNIETISTGGYSWVGSGLPPYNPVTYSVTITNFPGATYSNFQANVMLVPFFPNLPTEANPDWAEGSVVALTIQNQADGSATGQFLYKVGTPAAGLTSLVTVADPSPLGTWSLTLNNDSVLVTSPSGNTATTNLPSGTALGSFIDPLAIYVGAQADLTNNIGQQVVISQFQIVSNSVSTILNDQFTASELNAAVWRVSAEDPNGILQVPAATALLLSWNLPDSSYRLMSNTNVINTNTWSEVKLPKTSFYTGRRAVFIPSSYLNTNQFYRLQNP